MTADGNLSPAAAGPMMTADRRSGRAPTVCRTRPLTPNGLELGRSKIGVGMLTGKIFQPQQFNRGIVAGWSEESM
jgi:hypothetical protein